MTSIPFLGGGTDPTDGPAPSSRPLGHSLLASRAPPKCGPSAGRSTRPGARAAPLPARARPLSPEAPKSGPPPRAPGRTDTRLQKKSLAPCP